MCPRYYTVREAAELLRICPESLRRAVRLGKIPGVVRVPGGRLIRIPASFIQGGKKDPCRDFAT
jgi:excisionase family DNA binding protein